MDDNISQLQSKNKELDYRLKEEKLKTETLLKERENFDELKAKHTETEANLQVPYYVISHHRMLILSTHLYASIKTYSYSNF